MLLYHRGGNRGTGRTVSFRTLRRKTRFCASPNEGRPRLGRRGFGGRPDRNWDCYPEFRRSSSTDLLKPE